MADTENKNTTSTVLDLLEEQAERYANSIRGCWEHAMKDRKENGTDMTKCFLVFHLASIKTFMHVVTNPSLAFSFVLGAVARELINNMPEEEKAELATITLAELDKAKREMM